MIKDCKNLPQMVTAATKYIFQKVTGPFRALTEEASNLKKFSEIKAERINAIRKKYEAFLEEDKKRKERNEFILGKLDKMRSCTTLVQQKYKSNHLEEIQHPTLYDRPAPHQEKPSGYSTYYPRTVNNLTLDLPRSENSILNEIASKYILIPKRYTNCDARTVHTNPTEDNSDWKSKYEILNDLKKQEKESDSIPSIRSAYFPNTEPHFNFNQNIPEKDLSKQPEAETLSLNNNKQEHVHQTNDILERESKDINTYSTYHPQAANLEPRDKPNEIDITYLDTANALQDAEARRHIVGEVNPGEHLVPKEVVHTKVNKADDAVYPEPEKVNLHKIEEPDFSKTTGNSSIRRINNPDNHTLNDIQEPVSSVTGSHDSNFSDNSENARTITNVEHVISDDKMIMEDRTVNGVDGYSYVHDPFQNPPGDFGTCNDNANDPVYDTNSTINDTAGVTEPHGYTPNLNQIDTPKANENYVTSPGVNEAYAPIEGDPNVDNTNLYEANYGTVDDTYDDGPSIVATNEVSDVDQTQQNTDPNLENIEHHAVEYEDPGSDLKAFYVEPAGPVDMQAAGDGYNEGMQNEYYEEQEQTYPVDINEHEETQQNYDPNYEMQYNMNTYDEAAYQQQDDNETYQQQGAYDQVTGQYEQQQGPEQEQGYVQQPQDYEQQVYEPDAYQQAGYEQYDHQQVYDNQQYQQENYETVQEVENQLDKEEGILPQEEIKLEDNLVQSTPQQ